MTFAKVLVTGGNGFIGAWTIKYLIDCDYEVLATVRSEDKAASLKARFPGLQTAIVNDITAADAYDDVVRDVEFIEHVAAPIFYRGASDSLAEFDAAVAPAIKSTLNILDAARRNGSKVKKIVLVSSIYAHMSPERQIKESGLVINEKSWSPVTREQSSAPDAFPLDAYGYAKAEAERQAWDYIAKHDDVKYSLTTVNPVYVIGPYLIPQPQIDGTVGLLLPLLTSAEVPAGGLYVAYVEDVANVLVTALEKDAAAGRRFIVSSSGFVSNAEFIESFARIFPDKKFPPLSKELKEQGTPELATVDASLVTELLGIKYSSVDKLVKAYGDMFFGPYGGTNKLVKA
ncbi:hypothetical protein V1514DRAFT_295116 [Lipomyces japonicus]|uniref:uncharacterized protein n=1 Tax=Lipomyces japonicus TaxID=56871 RepID=UPI0034CE2B59